MIFGFLISIVVTIVGIFSAFLPVADEITPTMLETINDLAAGAFMFDKLIPLDELFIAIGLSVGLEIVLAGLHLVRWLINMLPFTRV